MWSCARPMASSGFPVSSLPCCTGACLCLPSTSLGHEPCRYGKRFEAGRYALGKTMLYVSRGTGMEGKGAPRVRFLCPPEIVLWEICGEDGHHDDTK